MCGHQDTTFQSSPFPRLSMQGHGPTKLNRTCAGRILMMSLEGHLQVTSSKFDLDHSVTYSTHCYLNRMLFSHRRRFSLGLLAGADLQLMRLLKILKSQKNSIRFWLSLHCYFTQFSVQLGTGSNIVLDFFFRFFGNFYDFFTQTTGWVPKSTHQMLFWARVG